MVQKFLCDSQGGGFHAYSPQMVHSISIFCVSFSQNTALYLINQNLLYEKCFPQNSQLKKTKIDYSDLD